MSEPATVERSALGRLEYLGKGGTAVIHRLPGYRLPGLPPVVFKEYNAKTLAFAGHALRSGLLDLVQQRLRMPDEDRARWDTRITWALRVVEDGGKACGILLPLIPAVYFQELRGRTGDVRRVPREVDLLFGATDDMTRQGLPAVDTRARLGVAVQIAKVCAMMHDRKVVLGDISGRNMVYDLSGPRPRVMVIDADGARVEGKRGAFGGQAQTPHWEPPEALLASQQLRAAHKRGDQQSVNSLRGQTMLQNRSTDVYKLGLMLVRVVDHGRGKAVNRKPQEAVRTFHRAWGRQAAETLERSLSPSPADRPTAEELYRSMRRQQPAPAPAPVPPPRPLIRRRKPQTAPQPEPPTQPGPAIKDGTVVGGFVYRPGQGWVRLGT